MKNIWKWILGIVVILVVVAGLVGLGIVVSNSMAANMAQRQAAFNARATTLSAQTKSLAQGTPVPQTPPLNPPLNPPQNAPQNGPMMRGFPGLRNDGRMPMMQGRGFGFNGFRGGFMAGRAGSFGIGSLILGGLARLLLFGLVVLLLLGAYLLGRRSHAPAVAPAAAPAVAPAATHACAKCGQPVVDGSSYCPSCGEKQ